MLYEIAFLEDGPFDVAATLSGLADRAEFVEGGERLLRDPRSRVGLRLLFDYSALNLSGLSMTDVEMLASVGREPIRAREPWAVACIAPTDLAWGLSRMFGTLSDFEDVAAHHMLFRSREDAIAWAEALPPPPR